MKLIYIIPVAAAAINCLRLANRITCALARHRKH